MTNAEAVKWIKDHHCLDDWYNDCKDTAAMRKAIEALEKQIPKKPKIRLSGTTDWNTVCHCSSCGGFLVGTDKFCHHCGQALDWGFDNEEIH